MRNSASGMQFSSQILNSCSQIKLVTFGPNQSDDIFYYGRLKGKVTSFEEISCAVNSNGAMSFKTPAWGTHCTPGG
jgi:hypothetical protein